ncbi:hypothetical protein BCR32DRAFT_245389 [Anaeromyces robustus]|uniref:Uncharacterized protein n=1 Tax=Anaeromyces robustus TaxID=1754192 RepID=A0A1Y1X636_9FUNG|nr:hypothetical protein BCR32DRAFT_245389 [Anaeromyces robustus]|eukprot:ORX80764.1 hypothetical protein BCR32DRAFT_245389 [Anaeromyces robustus]
MKNNYKIDYFCVKNDTQQSLTFRLFEGHYDVYKYEFSSIKEGLINKTKFSDNYNITLLPNDRIIYRTMYSFIKSGGESTLELEDKSGSIVFVNNSFNDFKLGKSYIVKITSHIPIWEDSYLSIADNIFQIEPLSPLISDEEFDTK